MFYCAVDGMGCDIPTSPVVTVAVSVTVSIVSTITVILGLVALCKLFQWYTKSSKWKQRVLICIIMYNLYLYTGRDGKAKPGVVQCALNANPAYEVHSCRAHITAHGAVHQTEHDMENNSL